VVETPRGYYLKCHSEKCKGKRKCIGEIEYESEFIKDGYQIKQEYLIIKKIFEDDKVGRKIILWMTNEKLKIFIVKSPMGTGKTTMVELILDKYSDLKRILWITHRQTLTEQIYGKFAEKGFVNYSEKKGSLFECDKLIVQIDSLNRITKMYENGNYEVIPYDLVIIDEIEGALNHYTSPYLENAKQTSRSTFDFMRMCMKNAKKVLLMDADVGIRTQILTHDVGSHILVNNQFKPIKKKFIITKDSNKFHTDIMKDIDDKLNVCILSMSASNIEGIAEILKEKKINYVIHTSHTDDKLKKKLRNVNDHWKQYQVVLFSPCIESGVDFNEEHFDKMYGILKSGKSTCSQRAFLQMTGRIRKLKNTNISCLYQGEHCLEYKKYTYDDVLCRLNYCGEVNGKKLLSNFNYEETITDAGIILVTRKRVEISTYDMINIHNEVEQLNKNHLTFLPVLFSLINRGGHEVVPIDPESEIIQTDSEPVEVVKIPGISMKKRILDIDETRYDLNLLLKKQSNNQLDENEKIALKKIFMIKSFGIIDTTDRKLCNIFLGKYAGKEDTIRRFEDLFGYAQIEPVRELESTTIMEKRSQLKLDNILIAGRKTLRDVAIDIINSFMDKKIETFKPDTFIDKTMFADRYNKAITDISQNSIYFNNQQEIRQLLSLPRKKYKPLCEKNERHYISSIQYLLGLFGIMLRREGRTSINKQQVWIYKLFVDQKIKHIADIKLSLKSSSMIIRTKYRKLFAFDKQRKVIDTNRITKEKTDDTHEGKDDKEKSSDEKNYWSIKYLPTKPLPKYT